MRTTNVIKSQLHDVYTEEVNKVALSAEDDKRVVIEDGIHTLAYGHYRLKKLKGTRAHARRDIKSVIGFIFQSRCFPKHRPICVPRFPVVSLTKSALLQF